jgi:hypothetical protein
VLGTGTREERVAKIAGLSAAISSRTCELVQALTQGSATDALLAEWLAALDERRRGEVADPRKREWAPSVSNRRPTD